MNAPESPRPAGLTAHRGAPAHTATAFAEAAGAFRRFFQELRDAFLEREALFTQIELALLCREHVLIIGPPGTAKSAIASAVLGRIVDENTNKPSVFSKQLAENTVQTDLIGPVDFKVLTETGRTEYVTEDGMLGAHHAFLDEVFDGRDMLLRSILNVLHERELKHGRKVTPGKCECAIMTSNRYLSEVVQRSPETLQAFADRISYICYCPKQFARKSSRAQMLARASFGQRTALSERITLQHLDVLQDLVAQVEVPGAITDGLEQISDLLERELVTQVMKLPDYVPTKYFSQRSVVKGLWSLKAAVVRDKILRRPERRLVVGVEDLAMLRYFFLLGGPPPEELEHLLKTAADPRERAQLEIIRVEHKAFDEVLAKVLPGLAGGADREAAELGMKEDVNAAEASTRAWNPAVASTVARSLRDKLVPGPRHPENRAPLVTAAAQLVSGMEQRLARGMAGQGEGRGGVTLLGSFSEVLEMTRGVSELQPRQAALAKATVEFCKQAAQMIALSAEGTEYDDALKLEGLTGLAANLSDELSRINELLQQLVSTAPGGIEAGTDAVAEARERVAVAIRRRAARTFKSARRQKGEALDLLAADSRRLKEMESALMELSPNQRGLRLELLTPLGESYLRDFLNGAQFTKLEQLVRGLTTVVEALRREGSSPELAMQANLKILEERVTQHCTALAKPAQLGAPDVQQVLGGEAYLAYRQQLAANAPDGELSALAGLESLVTPLLGGRRPFGPGPRDALANAEVGSLASRVRFLRSWLSQLLGSLPAPEDMSGRADADRAFDKLVKSRFPMLATKEGELVRLQAALNRLLDEPGERGEASKKLDQALRGIAEDFASFSKRLLEARAGR